MGDNLSTIFKMIVVLVFLALLGCNAYYTKKLGDIKEKENAELASISKNLDLYKPSTVSRTLQTDDKFMSILVKLLSDDKDFLNKLSTEIKKKEKE